MKRGPKLKTVENSARLGLIRHDSLDRPCELTAEARSEYDRVLGVIRDKGTLDKVDLAVVAECARVKDLLDRAHKAVGKDLDWPAVKLVGFLTTQRRGLLRELGLTTQPCRVTSRS